MEVLPQIVAPFSPAPVLTVHSGNEPKVITQIPLAALPQHVSVLLSTLTARIPGQIHLENYTLQIGGNIIPLPLSISLPAKKDSLLSVLVSVQKKSLTIFEDERLLQSEKPFHVTPLPLKTSIAHLQEVTKDIFPKILRQKAREALLPPLRQNLDNLNQNTQIPTVPLNNFRMRDEKFLTASHLEKSSALKSLLVDILGKNPSPALPPHSTVSTRQPHLAPLELPSKDHFGPAQNQKSDTLIGRKEQPEQQDRKPTAMALLSRTLPAQTPHDVLLQKLDMLLLQAKPSPQGVKELLESALKVFVSKPEIFENAGPPIQNAPTILPDGRPIRQEQLLPVIQNLLKTLDEPQAHSFTPSDKSTMTSILREIRALLSRTAASRETSEPELFGREQVLPQKGEPLEAIKIKPEARATLQNIVEQFFQGQELLGRLNPIMQQLGEPIFLLVPGFLQGFLQRLEVTIHPTYDESTWGKKRKSTQYSQCSVQCEFPSLGQIRLDIAYSKKHVLMRFLAESVLTAMLIQGNLAKLAEILSSAGFPNTDLSCQQQDRLTPIRPGWVEDITGLRMLV